MLIAQKKRKENIAEYLLYLFQIEDMIRAYNFDLNRIDNELISQYQQDYEIKREIREWYNAIITMLKDNDKSSAGHIPIVETLIKEVNDLHVSLLSKKKEEEYHQLYNNSTSAIKELKLKSGNSNMNDIEAALNGLYGFLLLKIQHKEISQETTKAFKDISSILSLLSQRFKEVELGEKEF